jgi:hypothetical protein
MAGHLRDRKLAAILAHIRVARSFLHPGHPTTWQGVRRIRQVGQRFLQKFGAPWELAKFDEAWHDAFLTVPVAGRVEKDRFANDEAAKDEIPWYHPQLARQAIFVLASVLRRRCNQVGDNDGEVTDINLVRVSRLPKTKREKFFRSHMSRKKIKTYQQLAQKAGVNVATVSRIVRRRAPKNRGLSDARIKVYGVLGLVDESEIPEH